MRNVLLAVVGLAVFAGVAATAPVPKALKKKPLRATIEPLPGERMNHSEHSSPKWATTRGWLSWSSMFRSFRRTSRSGIITDRVRS